MNVNFILYTPNKIAELNYIFENNLTLLEMPLTILYTNDNL